jgi:hypothetical protein
MHLFRIAECDQNGDVDRGGDLEREQDIEELRTIALAQHTQIQALLKIVANKSREVDRLRGSGGDLQLTLKMLADLQAKARRLRRSSRSRRPRNPRSASRVRRRDRSRSR